MTRKSGERWEKTHSIIAISISKTEARDKRQTKGEN